MLTQRAVSRQLLIVTSVFAVVGVSHIARAGNLSSGLKKSVTTLGMRLVPTRVSRSANGSVVLTRYGEHNGELTNIERITSTDTLLRHEVLKTSIVDGDRRDLNQVTQDTPWGSLLTETRRAGEQPVFSQSAQSTFKPMSYRRGLWLAVKESPVVKTLVVGAVFGAGSAFDAGMFEYIVNGHAATPEAIHTIQFGLKLGLGLGVPFGAMLNARAVHSRTVETTHTPARVEVIPASTTTKEY